MFTLRWGDDGGVWKLLCRFFVWEEDLVGEYNGVLSNVVSQVDTVDK
jgi:hypothetical protein